MEYEHPAMPHLRYKVSVYRDHVMVHRRNVLINSEQAVMLDGKAAESLHTDLLRIELDNPEPQIAQQLGAERLARLFK